MSAAHIALLGQANSIHLQRWAIALQAAGRRVTVLSQQHRDALPLPEGVDFVALPVQGAAGYFANAVPLRRWLQRARPDLLHAHYASGYGTTAALAGYSPLLLSVWGSDVYDFPYEHPLKAWLLRRNLRAADGLASTSHAMAAQVRRVWPDAGAIAVTPFGVDLDHFRPAPQPVPDGPQRSQARPLVVGTVKTLMPKYGIDTLLHAYALLRGERWPVPLRLRIVGDGPQAAELQALARTLGVADGVDWVGRVPHAQVPTELQQLDVYVAASRLDSESFGVAVVEAMACGVPVVVSDAGGLPEVVGQGRWAPVVPRDDPDALAAAIAPLLQSAALRAERAAAGRLHVGSEYAWPSCVTRMLACQDAVIRAGSRRRA